MFDFALRFEAFVLVDYVGLLLSIRSGLVRSQLGWEKTGEGKRSVEEPRTPRWELELQLGAEVCRLD